MAGAKRILPTAGPAGKYQVIGWHQGPGRRILATDEQLDGLPVVRVGSRCRIVHRVPTDDERRRLAQLGLTCEAIIEVDRGDDDARGLRRLVPARELYPAGTVRLVVTSDPTEPSPITPYVLHEQHPRTWTEPQSWNLPVLAFCQRCGETVQEFNRYGVPYVACAGCGRRIESHTFGLALITWLYQHLRRRGDLPEVELSAVAAVLGLTLDHFAQHISKLVVNTQGLRLWTTTGGPYLRTHTISLGFGEISSEPDPTIVDRMRLNRREVYC